METLMGLNLVKNTYSLEFLRRHHDLMPYVAVSTGSSYYDNVRPLAYPDSDAVLICFDISRPETLDSVIKKVSIFNSILHSFLKTLRQHLIPVVIQDNQAENNFFSPISILYRLRFLCQQLFMAQQ